jgi:hypothetical protein
LEGWLNRSRIPRRSETLPDQGDFLTPFLGNSAIDIMAGKVTTIRLQRQQQISVPVWANAQIVNFCKNAMMCKKNKTVIRKRQTCVSKMVHWQR